MSFLRRIAFVLVAQFVLLQPVAALPDSTLVVSLLTTAPGPDLHEGYGHTALRIRSVGTDYDWAFNYGVFSYQMSHFLWRFLMGNAEYVVRAIPTDIYLEEYAKEHRKVDEQQLNVSQDEAVHTVTLLEQNVLDESWSYVYSFLYDNCTTRIYDKIVEGVEGEVVLPAEWDGKSFRDMLHEFAGTDTWTGFIADLAIGAEADRIPSQSERIFLPLYAERLLSKAQVKGADGSQRPLVRHTLHHSRKPEYLRPKPLIPPFVVLLVLMHVAMIAGLYNLRGKRKLWVRIFDASVLVAVGLGGVLVLTIFCFSQNPSAGSNWNVLWLNPLPLAAVVLPQRGLWRKVKMGLYALLLLLGAIYTVAMLLGAQSVPSAAYLLALSLLYVVAANLWRHKKAL